MITGLAAGAYQFRKHRQRIDHMVRRFVAYLVAVIIAITDRDHATSGRLGRAYVIAGVTNDRDAAWLNAKVMRDVEKRRRVRLLLREGIAANRQRKMLEQLMRS